jgi:hypothetical protein
MCFGLTDFLMNRPSSQWSSEQFVIAGTSEQVTVSTNSPFFATTGFGTDNPAFESRSNQASSSWIAALEW